MRLRHAAWIAVVGTTAVARPAGAATARAVTFAEARAAAVRAGPAVVVAARRAGVAHEQIGVAGALGNPTLTFTTARQTARLASTISVPVPLFGQRGRAVAAAEGEAKAAALDVGAAAVESRFGATVAWIDLWEAQERARLLGEAAAEADRVARIAEEKFAAGAGPQVDVLRTRADRVRSATEATGAELSIAAAGSRLAAWMATGDAGAPRAAGDPGFSSGAVARDQLARRLDQAPALRRDAADVAAAGARIRLEERLRWPIVSLLLSINQSDPTLPGTDVIAGLSFDAPLLSLRRGAIARAQAEAALATATYAVDAGRLRRELDDAAARAQAAEGRARALGQEVLPALESAWRMTEEGYRDGRVDLLRLLDARRAVVEARIARTEAEASWQRAVAEVERAAGVTVGANDAP